MGPGAAVERAVRRMERLAASGAVGDAPEGPGGPGRAAGIAQAAQRDGWAALEAAREAAQGRRGAVQVLGWEARLRAAAKDPGAEELLCRAAKLDPTDARVWNALGELHWANGDLTAAHHCFTSCLEFSRDIRAMRSLSMLLRKVGATPQERAANTKESLRVAKAAVALDCNSHESWYLLGNTYLSLFFAVSHDPTHLEAALKAYRRSEALERGGCPAQVDGDGDSDGERNPDLYFNRGKVFEFLEEYAAAVKDYEQAGALDPRLPSAQRIESIFRRVGNAAGLVQRKGHLKSKRLAAITKSLGRPEDDLPIASPTAASARRVSTLADLSLGKNTQVRLDVAILLPLASSGDPPLSFLAVDRTGTAFGVSVYHLDAAVLAKCRSGRDRITLVEPLLREVRLGAISYPLLQLQQPTQFFVNGELLSSSFAHAALDLTSFSEQPKQ